MSFTTKKLGLGLIAGLLLSSIPAQEAQAFAPIEAFKALTPGQKAAVIAAIAITPYLVNFFGRKPLTTPRFDKEILLNGSVVEKAKQLHYFFVDVVLGWPRKDNKVVVADKDGKPALDVKFGQEPGGALGLGYDYLESTAKALDLPRKALTSVAAIVLALKFCSNIGTNVTNSLDGIVLKS